MIKNVKDAAKFFGTGIALLAAFETASYFSKDLPHKEASHKSAPFRDDPVLLTPAFDPMTP